MKRLLLVFSTALLVMVFAPSAASAATMIDPSAAPSGTHLQRGTIDCTESGDVVTCDSYELAGVGNANASVVLSASYTATVECRNRGGQIVEVKSQVTSAPVVDDDLEPKNGRLAVPSVSTTSVPSNAAFEATATCPNGNWRKETLTGSIDLSSWTYTMTFAGFSSPYITITS